MRLLVLFLLLGAAPPSENTLANLDFAAGTLAGWENQGDAFYITTAGRRGPSLACGVCSSDRGKPGRTGLLSRAILLPAGASEIHFRAYAVRAGAGHDWPGDARLDVLLLAPGKRIIPKQVLTRQGWQPAPLLLPRRNGRPGEYRWDVTAHAGRPVQIVIGDQDGRPGSHVFCSGFQVVLRGDEEARSFAQFMVRLAAKHQLAPPTRYDSRHFTALSNADETFTRTRLHNCELIYSVFFDHFRRKGFQLQPPPAKLMVAIFDSQAGFDAYVGRNMGSVITGMYHPQTNRLVVYDYGSNEAFVAYKQRALDRSRTVPWQFDRKRYVETVDRQAREHRTGTNIGTTMHEVAHQLSFNTGLLNRKGDVAFWVAEGLACYCEPSDHGAWQGIGEPNPDRLNTLSQVLAGRGKLLALDELVISDRWRQAATDSFSILAGYAQSWALFRMLMEDQPRAMQKYLTSIYQRRTPDHRLTDFRQAFGPDLSRLERRYRAYLKQIVQEYESGNRRGLRRN
jgi:hypothetical protein